VQLLLHNELDKRAQSSSTLKFWALTDETCNMPLPAQPTRNERQLVFTSSQAARYMGVSLATVRRWTDAGHVSCYRTPGGQRRFSRAQLDSFLASMQRGGQGEEPTAVERHDAQVA
jgi:excisionase family DNA binding protein